MILNLDRDDSKPRLRTHHTVLVGERSIHWCWYFDFFFQSSLVCVICLRVFDMLEHRRSFSLSFVFCRWLAFFTVRVVSIVRAHARKLEISGAATLLTWKNTDVLRSPAHRSTITTPPPDITNAPDSFSLFYYLVTLSTETTVVPNAGFRCVFSSVSLSLVCKFTPREGVVHCVELLWCSVFLLCFCFGFKTPRRDGFVPLARRVFVRSRAYLWFRVLCSMSSRSWDGSYVRKYHHAIHNPLSDIYTFVASIGCYIGTTLTISLVSVCIPVDNLEWATVRLFRRPLYRWTDG